MNPAHVTAENHRDFSASQLEFPFVEDIPPSRFTYVDVTTQGCEGTLNLFFDDFCVAYISNIYVAQQLREELTAKRTLKGKVI